MQITTDSLFIYVSVSNITTPGRVVGYENTSGKNIWFSPSLRTGTWTETIPRSVITVSDAFYFYLDDVNENLIGYEMSSIYLTPLTTEDITISSLSWDTPDSATSKIKFTLATTGSGIVSVYVDGSLDYVYLYIPGIGSDKTLFSYATNTSHNICFGSVCKTLEKVVITCPLMIRPIISPTSMTATVGGQLTFTTTSIGGTTTKDGMRHVVKLGNTVIYDSGVGQATSITKTVTLPPSITAGSYQLTTTVSDGCLPTHQTMISGSVTINVTEIPIQQGYNCGACNILVINGTYQTSSACTVGCGTCINPKYKCNKTVCISDNCDGTGTLPAGCSGTCNILPKICLADEMPILGSCYKKNDVYMIIGGFLLFTMIK